ncbi:TraR/DksA family transcriptional regulator [Candidatus Symbiopectobacterium sp. NZEC135]|uniref:TraR/DksA family transcriptional regulator n=1 Tax=Candidatus Symbiopectobacterium sp. NZEC135 TaxID=2820471 RepID=UPI002226755B|nr:TraR/DksA family transcriptional regulator [Candidatus Symbiopectobacterium sp. NZEC135]MCW2479162.1 TraR/DksA family transcriptional regulator [Candidatus Symbiopectobacterium sp. NZEC135]
MPDLMDLVQQRQQEMLEHQIANARNAQRGVSAFECEDCAQPIPEARRMAIVGVTRCATCQSIQELKGKHYRGGL